MSKLVKGIHHVALKANGYEEFVKTVDFYKNVLGLEEVRHWGEGDNSGIMLGAGGSIVEIFAHAKDVLPMGAIRHYAFEVDSADACVEAVKAAGYQVTDGPRDVNMASTPVFPIRVAFCIGPVGEEIEFFQIRE